MGKNVFEHGYWVVKYRTNKNDPWKKLFRSDRYWYADPMLFKHKGKIYLFTEEFDLKKQIGQIAVSKLSDGEFSSPSTIIKNKYHMSYPCVFEYNNNVYMIPETSQNRTLEIYQSVDDDLKTWIKKKILIKNIRLVDTTVYIDNTKVYLIGYIEHKDIFITKVYELNMDKMTVSEINSMSSRKNIYRPAGNVLITEEGKYRPLQYNINYYGEKIRLMKVDSMKDLKEKEDKIIDVKSYDGIGNEYKRTHTIGFVDNVQVVDLLASKKTLLAPLYNIKRRGRNFIYKIIKGRKEND